MFIDVEGMFYGYTNYILLPLIINIKNCCIFGQADKNNLK